MKRQFECGHSGKGKYCHRCMQDQVVKALSEAGAKRVPTTGRERRQLERLDVIDLSALSHLPALQVKARTILAAIASGARYTDFAGKRLESMQMEVVSIPIGNKWRLIYRGKPLRPIELLSHEAYNNAYVS